jgi:hypothetical protein
MKKFRFKKVALKSLFVFGLLSVLFFYGAVVPKNLHAQTSKQTSARQTLGIIISPPVFSNLTANPGSTISNVIKVYNTSPYPLNTAILVDNYTSVGDRGQVKLQSPALSSQYSLASWITVSPSNLNIAPDSYQYVKFTINVPLNAQPGSRFASVVASVSASQNSTSGSGVGTEIGSLILLTISGNVSVNATLTGFYTNPSFTQGGVLNFIQKIQNTGNVTLRPTGKIVISNMFGNTIKTISIQSLDVIPSAVRRSQEQINTKGYVGLYTASLFVNYNSEGKGGTLVGKTSFWVIPIYEILLIVVIIVLLVLFRKNILRAIRALFTTESGLKGSRSKGTGSKS